jgi:hypothetical protein
LLPASLKRKKEMINKLVILIVLILVSSCSKEELEIQQGDCIPFYISDTYKYPIMPGTSEWKELKSRDKMVEVCQIPGKKIKSISTEGLLETLLNYPLINDYYFFDNLQDGFNNIKNENNGFKELYKRKDIYKVITERYELMSLDCGENLYPPISFDNEASPVEVALLTYEFFIFQDEFLDKINENQRLLIFELVYDKLQLKKEYEYDNFLKFVSIAILGKIMYKNNYSPFVELCSEIDFIKYFIEKIPMFKPENIQPTDIIENYAKEFKASR